MITRLCTWLLRRLASVLDRSGREWVQALLAEVDAVPHGRERLLWTLSGLRLAVVLATRSRPAAAWWRHPGRVLAVLLGAPARAAGHRRSGAPGTGAYLIVLASACATGLAVVVLRGLLEDSPYPFNLGRGAATGIHPDWANPMSLAFDLVVLASAGELLAVAVLTVCFLRFRARAGRRLPGPVRVALLASAFPLWVLLGAIVLFGVAAQQNAATAFDQARAAGTYLTWASWLPLALVVAASAVVVTAAGVSQGRDRSRGTFRRA